jgi:hypothetical protein
MSCKIITAKIAAALISLAAIILVEQIFYTRELSHLDNLARREDHGLYIENDFA